MEFPITRNIQTNSSLELTTDNKCPSSGYSKQLEFCPSKLFRPISAFLDDSALCLHCHGFLKSSFSCYNFFKN